MPRVSFNSERLGLPPGANSVAHTCSVKSCRIGTLFGMVLRNELRPSSGPHCILMSPTGLGLARPAVTSTSTVLFAVQEQRRERLFCLAPIFVMNCSGASGETEFVIERNESYVE